MNFAKTGVLMYLKHYNKDVAEWQGPLTLADGTQFRMIAKAVKGQGYDVVVRDPAKGWAQIGAFNLTTFEGLTKQDVNVPNIGSLRAYIGKTKTKNEWCIRFVILDEKGRAPAPRPF